MAEADMKGKVSVEPRVIISTKNVKDSCARVYSNEPASITRRDRITIECSVKPQFATHGMLDENKVRKVYPDGPPLIPDFWNITVEKSFGVPNPIEGKPATVDWEVVKTAKVYPLKIYRCHNLFAGLDVTPNLSLKINGDLLRIVTI
jgi:hypothetical protein